MTLTIPELSLVVLIGPSGCGKSTFARKHFMPTEVMSSDGFRALVSDDENDQSSTDDAFAALHFVAGRRLARAKLTVIDATNVQPEARKPLVALAREYHVLPVAIVLDLPERVCHERNRSRPDRDFGPHVIRNQRSQLRRSLRGLGREGFRHVHVLKSQEEVDAAVIARQPLWNNRRRETGPFDIIGDVHGCCDELEQLLQQLGYERNDGGPWAHPAGRRAIFVGDLVDRGPRIVDTLKTVMSMSQAGTALSVPGNHDIKLKRKLEGRDVTVSHGLDRSLQELEQETSGVSSRGPEVPGWARQPLRLRRRSARCGACRYEGGDARAWVGEGAGLRPLRRDNRRDRRVRASGALQLGGRVPRTCQRGLRTHACPRARSGSIARSTSTPGVCSAAD